MLASGTKQQNDTFNTKLEERLDETNFMIDGVAGFDSAYLDDVKDDHEKLGVVSDRGIIPLMRIMGTLLRGNKLRWMMRKPWMNI